MMQKMAATILIISFTASCSKPTATVVDGLILASDYPDAINAQAVSGELRRSGDCVTFIANDGAAFIPVFRPGTTLGSLQSQVGSLAGPQRVTVSGMTLINPVPTNIAAAIDAQGCIGQPFFFGSFGLVELKPSAPGG